MDSEISQRDLLSERQLNQLNEIRTVVDARNDAATMASYAKVCVLVFQYLLM